MGIYTILVAEDDPLQRRTLRRMLEEDIGAEVLEAVDGAAALQRLKAESGVDIDLVLLDLQMPIMDGLTLLRQAHKAMPRMPFIVLTSSERVEDAVEAMQLGAIDFINKPAQRERLVTSVRNALALRELREEVGRLRQEGSPHYSFADIVEISPSLREVVTLARKAAGSEIPVLITGESGVGKEVFARAIHSESARHDKPFVSVNCGALPEHLVESALFGHEKGAFTGATSKSAGKCREADGGVLFLDEVGELKLDAQVKLLRMLQQGEIEPVGASRPVKVDVRVISATNRSLEQMVARGQFREDLYYRLHGLPLPIPSLRERRKDIASLAEHMLARIADHERRKPLHLTEEAKAWLQSYSWPGNVRELQHVLARAMLLAEGDMIEAGDLARWVKGRATMAGKLPQEQHATTIVIERPDGQLKTLAEIEQEVIEAALARHGAHIGRAAAALGIGQSTLYKRMRRED